MTKLTARTKIISKLLIFMLITAVFLSCFEVRAVAKLPDATELFYVNDYSGVFTDEAITHIVETNILLEEKTGAQVVVIATDFLNGYSIEDYCYEMFNKLKIGSATENNGVLLVLATGLDDYYVMTGTGLEEELSAGVLGEILYDYLEEDFAAGDYSEGTVKAFDEIVHRVCNIYGVTLTLTGDLPNDYVNNYGGYLDTYSGYYEPDPSSSGANISFITVFIAVIIIIAVVISYSRPRRYYGGYGGYGRPYRRRRFFPPIIITPPRGGYHPHHPHNTHMPPGHNGRSSTGHSNKGGGFFGGGGLFGGGGGSSRGGGIGRSGGFGGSSIGRSSFGCGSFRGGGGSTRGGGAGRK